jgi:predicted regulator of Ras-like GTPase activity (Roadblock/LC7/MglB family)
MTPEQALADLTEISSQIEAAVVFDGEGRVIGSTLDDESRAGQLASAAGELWRSAQEVKPGSTPTQFEVATTEGSLFVVRDEETYIAATTGGNPTVGLVFYDLKSTLRGLKKEPEPPPQEETAQKPATKPRKTTTASGTKKKTAARKTTTRKRKTDAP